MESLRELYRIGYGPSSSHTMGPRALRHKHFPLPSCRLSAVLRLICTEVLAATGKGHLTDKALREVFFLRGKKMLRLSGIQKIEKPFHPEMHLQSVPLSDTGEVIFENTYYSVGRRKKLFWKAKMLTRLQKSIPRHISKMRQILNYCADEGMQIWGVCSPVSRIRTFLPTWMKIWGCDVAMQIERGVNAEGVLPGGLKLPRKASQFQLQSW